MTPPERGQHQWALLDLRITALDAALTQARRVVACIATDSPEHALRYHVEPPHGCLRLLSDAIAELDKVG